MGAARRAGSTSGVSNGIPGKAVPEFTGQFDGIDRVWHGHKGPVVATLSLKLLDDHAFVETLKLGGSPFIIHEFVLSPSGKTIKKTTTIVGQAPGLRLQCTRRNNPHRVPLTGWRNIAP